MFNQKRYEQLLENWYKYKSFENSEHKREYMRLDKAKKEFLENAV